MLSTDDSAPRCLTGLGLRASGFRRTRVTVVASLCAPLLAACHGEGHEATRAEIGRVTEAVRKLRDAPPRGRAPLLQALKSTACSTDDGRALKKKCDDAYSLEERALQGISAVRREAVRGEAAEPMPSAAATLLSNVTADLERAKTLAESCADLESELRRKYSL